jgi:hypothetical protein
LRRNISLALFERNLIIATSEQLWLFGVVVGVVKESKTRSERLSNDN